MALPPNTNKVANDQNATWNAARPSEQRGAAPPVNGGDKPIAGIKPGGQPPPPGSSAPGPSPPVPATFGDYRWVPISSGAMECDRKDVPYTQDILNEVQRATLPSDWCIGTATISGRVFLSQAWKYILIGVKGQFAISFGDQKGEIVTPRPAIGVRSTSFLRERAVSRFANAWYHYFNWPLDSQDPDKNYIELNVQAGDNIIISTAVFAGSPPPAKDAGLFRWQLWHLRRPNDPEPKGNQDPYKNGFMEAKARLAHKNRMNADKINAEYNDPGNYVLEDGQEPAPQPNQGQGGAHPTPVQPVADPAHRANLNRNTFGAGLTRPGDAAGGQRGAVRYDGRGAAANANNNNSNNNDNNNDAAGDGSNNTNGTDANRNFLAGDKGFDLFNQ